MRNGVLIAFFAALAAAIGIAAAQAVGSDPATPVAKSDPPGAAEAPALGVDDVPVQLTPGTVELGPEEARRFRERWSRDSVAGSAQNPSPAAGAMIKAHGRTKLGDGLWWVTTYRSADGMLCYGEKLPGGQGIGCYDEETMFRDGPLFVGSGRRQAGDSTQWNVFWISGLTRAPAETVEIVSTDCARTDVRLDAEGVFLHLVGPGKIYSGVWPYRVVARAADGRIVAEKWLRLEAPDTPAAREAGVRAPRPQGCA